MKTRKPAPLEPVPAARSPNLKKRAYARIPASALLKWYDRVKRDMPWRRTKDPYAIWLSEIMLQQTRVDTVIAYWNKFMQTWPTATALANAPLDDVLAAWAGLGYYARARNLHKAAKEIRDAHRGDFPGDAESVRALPGIGRYTAGAILSIAFGKPEPLVDGNVVRVLARLHGLEGHAKERTLHATCWEIAALIVPADRPGDFNQALMELGATVCTPAKPKCAACPVAAQCVAREAGTQEQVPATPPRAVRPHRTIEAAFVERDGAILLVRRPDEGLLGGMWEMPSAEREGAPGASASRALAALGLHAAAGDRVASIEHAFTHFDMTLQAFVCNPAGEIRPGSAELVREADLARYALGAATKRAIEAARETLRQPSLFAGGRARSADR